MRSMGSLLKHHLNEVAHAKQKPSARLRILQVMSNLDPKLGGISAVVPRLTREMQYRHSIDAQLCLFSNSHDPSSVAVLGDVSSSVWPSARFQWVREEGLRRKFQMLVRAAAGVHIHGLWENSVTVASRTSIHTKTPYVISAHGMLEPWALANKALKKKIYSALFERKNLNNATCLHALTGAEAEDYRRFGCKQPIAVIANGVDSPPYADPDLFLRQFPAVVGKSILLFLGRIHFKKGLDVLIPAWAAIAHRFPDTVLVLAGPDSENSMASAKQSLENYGIGDRTLFTGMLDADLKWSALSAATGFVLPSYSEGLSVAVLEALSIAVPVIVSEQCHIPEVATEGAGWVIKTDVPALQQALTALLKNTSEANATLGARGKVLAQRYRWDAVSENMAKLYEWLGNGASLDDEAVKGLWV